MFFLQDPRITTDLQPVDSDSALDYTSIHSQLETRPVGRRGNYYQVPALNPSTGYTAVIQRVGPYLQVVVCDSTGEIVSTVFFESWEKTKANRMAKRLLKRAGKGIFTDRPLYSGVSLLY